MDAPILVLNGDGGGPVNNLCVPSNLSEHHAPSDRALISASVIGPDAPESAVIEQLRNRFV